jgi:hypothetical protein
MPFVAPTPWSAERPKALVVCCSDGRWHAQMMEFVRAEVCSRADLYAVPGGPAVLDPWNSTFDEARAFEEGMRLFVKHHLLESVWLIAHEGCAFYREKHPHYDPAGLRRRQIEDLARARKMVLGRHAEMDVRLIFASRREEVVMFDPCDSEIAEEKP